MNAPETRDSALESDILAAVESLQDDMVDLATTLVRFPSLNGEEAGAQDFIEGLFRGMGLETERFEVRDADLKHLPSYSPSVGQWERHDNVVGIHRARSAIGRSLILNINAIEAAFALWHGLLSLETHWNVAGNRHPAFAHLEYPIRFNLGKINGGEWASSVPTRCVMELRCGFYPGVTAAQARAAIEMRLAETMMRDPALAGVTHRVRYTGFQAEGFVLDGTAPLLSALAAAHSQVMNKDAEWFASSATTDARAFNLYGSIPATCYGPEAQNIHGIDESVSIESALRVAQVLALFMARWCGVENWA